MDGDSDLDLAVANRLSGDVSILFNLTNTVSIAATVVDPDTMYAFFVYCSPLVKPLKQLLSST